MAYVLKNWTANGRHRKWTAGLLLTTALATVALAPAASSWAQSAARVQLDIPVGPLSRALSTFGRQTGFQVTYLASFASGKSSPGFSGSASAQEALAAILQGSGLVYSFPNATTVTISQPSADAGPVTADGSTLLSTINVEGQGPAGIAAQASAAGTKTDIPLVEIPQAVSVVTRKELDERKVNDLNDAVAYTPGIRMVDYTSNQGLPLVYMRGFFSQSQRTYYRDGLRNGFNPYDMTIEPYGLESISVLKGPASALYGDALPGGLIDMTTKRPTEERFGEVQVEYGSFDEKQIAVDFGGPGTEDGAVLYRFTALKRDADTQVDYSPNDALYIAPALTWKADDATSLTILGQYQEQTRSGSEQSIPLDNATFGSGFTIPSAFYMGAPGISDWNSKTTSIGYNFEHEFDNGWKLNNNLRYTHSELDFASSWIWDWPVAVVDDHYVNVGLQQRPRTSDSVLFDLNLAGAVETGPLVHDLLLGASYGYSNIRETRTNSTNYNHIDILDPNYDFDYTYGLPWSASKELVSQFGLYAQDQIKWDNWILTLNGRYDWVDMTTYDYYSKTVYAAYGYTDTKSTEEANAFTGRIGLAYTFENGFVPYASYSTSFEPASGTDYNGNTFEPTTGTQHEVGLKYQPLGWNGFFSVALFDLTQQNVTTTDPNHSGYSVQQGEIRSRGLELEAKGEIADGWSFVASYAYTNAEVTKDNPDSSGISEVGTHVKAVPYHTASLWLNYAFEDPMVEGLSIGSGIRYVGGSYTAMDSSTGTQTRIPGYTLIDAAVTYDFGRKSPDLDGLMLALSGTNLTDERYYTPGFYSNSVLDGKRRTIKATLNYRW
ncbi:TonB-dependent siderophore receptor [Agrobacterium sp. ES01]|uniref:TonB-dependent siderophore receptor n=1 Tax=Agrobacterium sp. ES01 TaxID=3420714 RepID=UPI003D0FB9E9